MQRLRLALYIVAGFWFGGLAAFALFPEARERLTPSISMRSVGQALVGGPFTLTDHNGKRVTDKDFRGKFMVVFFGFTNCPDVCPTALQVMAAALDKLGANAERVTPVFISIDPEHDKPAQLASYVASFHPRLVGLTGSQAEIDAVAKAYRVYVKKVPDPK
jgi:protein SCO1/2